MNDGYVIGMDCGTQSVKAIVFNLEGEIIAEAKEKTSSSAPYPGWVEQNPEDWWSASCSVLRKTTGSIDRKNIVGLGVSYQRESFVALDDEMRPIRPAILWNDQRSLKEIELVGRDVGRAFFHETTGKFLDTVVSATKIKWIQENEKKQYKRIHKLLDVGGFLNWKLTGSMISPSSGIDSLGLFDIKNMKWADGILDYLEIRNEFLPEVVPAGTIVGKVTAVSSESTGLPVGLPIVAAGGDGQVFAIGMNALAENELALTLGTSIAWGVHLSTCVSSEHFRTLISGQPETYYVESALIAGSSTLSWFLEKFGMKNATHESALDKEAAAITPGCDGLITIPYWKGNMMPYNDLFARGLTIGWSDYHGSSHFYRSILEGVGYEIRMNLEGYKEKGIDVALVKLGSGGAESSLWNQIICDILGKRIEVSATTENTALGAAMITAWGLKKYKSLSDASSGMYKVGKRYTANLDNHGKYSEFFNKVYKKIYPAIGEQLSFLGKYILGEKNEK